MKILFVCTGNSYRSPVASALLKKAREDLEVESAGTHPAGMIASNAKQLLEEENARAIISRLYERNIKFGWSYISVRDIIWSLNISSMRRKRESCG